LNYFVVNAKNEDMFDGITAVDTDPFPKADPDTKLTNTATLSDTAVLIYTSGTTGLPKPATINHLRLISAALMFPAYGFFTKEDRVYTCLPLYHSSAAMCGAGSAIMAGAALILSPKFSASRCMKECTEFKATTFQYIGEIARFLLSSKESEYDKAHSLRLAYGNGLRREIWLPFKKRFNINTVIEFYGSTEGNASIFNVQTGDVDGVGAVGKVGPLFRYIQHIRLVKYDPIEEKPYRDESGRCIACKPEEMGELISEIKTGSLTQDFKGYYNNQAETDKKILSNVFRKGDRWFRTVSYSITYFILVLIHI
jgi:fatty-acyl-CoA synthase